MSTRQQSQSARGRTVLKPLWQLWGRMRRHLMLMRVRREMGDLERLIRRSQSQALGPRQRWKAQETMLRSLKIRNRRPEK